MAALSTLVNMIESSILRKEICLVIYVDIQGALNNLATRAIKKGHGWQQLSTFYN